MDLLDDPVFGTTKTAPEKGNKKPPPPPKAAKPEPPAKKVKAPAPAPAKNVKASKVSPSPRQLTHRATLSNLERAYIVCNKAT